LAARERFVNPNNATLVVVGGVQPNRAKRALRQLLGIWRKSEQIIPNTFRQPEPADARTLVVNAPSDQSVEIRLAVRGLARSDRENAAATLLAGVANQRWQKLMPELARKPVFVRHEAHALPGMFVMGASVDSSLAAKSLESARAVLQSFATTPISPFELEQARRETLDQISKGMSTPEGLAVAWLDLDTYSLPALSDQLLQLNLLSASDLKATAIRLFQNAALASVAVGNSAQLKTELEGKLKIEVLGEIVPKSQTNSDVKPATTPTPVIKPD
jgi:predicted Zn-dependent peptidase